MRQTVSFSYYLFTSTGYPGGFLNPINKMADEASAILLFICSNEVWVKETYDWPTALYLCLCLSRPRFHRSQSYEIIISTSTRRTNLSVFLVLMLMSTQPSSLAYRCACACAYACAYALVKTRLKACQTTSSDGKRYRGLCRPNRLYFNYCLETTAKFKLN